MSRVELHREWEQRITEFRASGQSAVAWCAAEQLNLHRFRYWLRKFPLSPQSAASTHGSVQWLSVRTGESASVEDAGLVVRIGRASIEIKTGYNPTLLTQVIQTLVPLW